ncbi:MAG: hypothetical protein QOH06_2043 [Acidobacteriota bacterium]|jgi:CHAT domain-containing protein|nr:hypothetical protein [Acidobacteriota bacterium]
MEPRQLASVLRGGEDAERRTALARLLLNRKGDRLEPIVSRLEAAARRAPRKADPLVDLAAAQLTAGWVQGSATSFVDALDSSERALEIEPGNPRACFNRAFALGELGLRELAIEGWRRCAPLEEDPEWRAEALQRAEALRVPPAAPSREESADALDDALRNGRREELGRWSRDNPHLAVDLVVSELLPRWVESGPIEGAAWWPGLEQLADGVRKTTGDRLLEDIVRQMRHGLAAGAAGCGQEMAEGVRRLRSGFDAYRKREFREAEIRLRPSEEGSCKVPAPGLALGMIAQVYRAVALNASGEVDAARKELSHLVPDAGKRSYHWPLGYAHWTLGRMAMADGRPFEALRHYRQADQAFERIRAGGLVLSVRMMLAEAYAQLGQGEPAWQFARGALLEAYRTGAADPLFFALNLFAGIADEQGRPNLALYAQSSALDHAAGVPPRLQANAHLWRAYFLGIDDLQEPAQEDLRDAERLAREVEDPSESARLEAEIHLVQGVLAARTNPEAAVASLGDAADLFGQKGERVARLVALKTRAEALRKMGRVEEAAADLEKAIATYDEVVRQLAEDEEGGVSEPDRLSFLRQNADVYQEVVDLHVRELASPWKALLYAEHAKSLLASGKPRELVLPENAIDQWSQALPPETALLSYGLAGDRIVAWVLTPTGRRFFSLGNTAEVADLTDRLGRAPDARTWEALSRELYRRLIFPLAEPLRPLRRLLIVPSPGLDRVPFAGLLDPSGRYLAETYLLEMLPCASALQREDGPPENPGARRRALVVGNPQPTHAGLLGLDPLRFAEQEARDAAASLGPDTVLLLGPDATPGRFREQAVGADVIHVAGHALSLGRGPGSAALVLATGDGNGEGLLTARDVLDLKLAGTSLVVLSACSSAGGPVVSWQSGLTLARSFLSAGADRVIATLHAVDDEESARLFQVFYRELAAGQDAAASLRSAQREVLRSRSGAKTWTPPSWPYVIILGSRPSK